MLIWVIDGDGDIIDDMQEWFPESDVRGFDVATDVFREPGPPDAMLIDIGKLAGDWPQPQLAARIARQMIESFGNATVFVTSAVGVWAQDAVDEMREDGLVPIYLGPEDRDKWPEMMAAYGVH